MSGGPVTFPRDWGQHVNRPQTEGSLEALAMRRGQPYGSVAWTRRTAARHHLESTLVPRGRPKKQPATES